MEKPGPSPPRRRTNQEVRGGKEHLTEQEVESLIRAAGRSARFGHRDATMVLIAYTHGLRASELVALNWTQIDLRGATIAVKRCKGSISGTHPLRDREVRALRKLSPKRSGPVFVSRRFAAVGESRWRKIVQQAGAAAGLGPHVHPHMLRHSCGYKLTNQGVDLRVIQSWLGHANVQNTVLYTHLSAHRFAEAKLWED